MALFEDYSSWMGLRWRRGQGHLNGLFVVHITSQTVTILSQQKKENDTLERKTCFWFTKIIYRNCEFRYDILKKTPALNLSLLGTLKI